jgi:hypothetical protein
MSRPAGFANQRLSRCPRDLGSLAGHLPKRTSSTDAEAIKGHRFRFTYGPQANKQLPKLRIPRAPFFVPQSTLPDLVSLVA